MLINTWYFSIVHNLEGNFKEQNPLDKYLFHAYIKNVEVSVSEMAPFLYVKGRTTTIGVPAQPFDFVKGKLPFLQVRLKRCGISLQETFTAYITKNLA